MRGPKAAALFRVGDFAVLRQSLQVCRGDRDLDISESFQVLASWVGPGPGHHFLSAGPSKTAAAIGWRSESSHRPFTAAI